MFTGRTLDDLGIDWEQNDLDYEIQDLIKCINKVPGIETIESCFGHYKTPCQVWCKAQSIEAVNRLKYDYFYRDDLWEFKIILSDVQIDDRNLDKELLFVLESRYRKYPKVDLMVNELTKRFKLYQLERGI